LSTLIFDATGSDTETKLLPSRKATFEAEHARFVSTALVDTDTLEDAVVPCNALRMGHEPTVFVIFVQIPVMPTTSPDTKRKSPSVKAHTGNELKELDR